MGRGDAQFRADILQCDAAAQMRLDRAGKARRKLCGAGRRRSLDRPRLAFDQRRQEDHPTQCRTPGGRICQVAVPSQAVDQAGQLALHRDIRQSQMTRCVRKRSLEQGGHTDQCAFGHRPRH